MRPHLLVAVPVLLLALAGCGESAAPARPAGPGDAPAAVSTSLADLQTKLASIAKDECALTKDPAAVYPRCGRFVREVQNSTPAARADSAGLAIEPGVRAAADAVDAAVDQMARDQCTTPMGAGTPGPPEACGPDLVALQAAVKALVAAVGTAP
ncbi:MAG: hypothetical protein OJJ54_10400 [Pseudonocardia sp.]|nr:hypothetical protein [Pseudonocardia sp.]